jgi:heme O synthase-like polyprenyltransferase
MMAGDAFGFKKAIEGYKSITGLQAGQIESARNWAGVYGGVIVFMLEMAGILAVFMIVWSGYKYLTAYGSEEKAASAKKSFIYALLGLAIALSALFIVSLVAGLTSL